MEKLKKNSDSVIQWISVSVSSLTHRHTVANAEILTLFIIWRVALVLLGYFALRHFAVIKNFYGTGDHANFFRAWANWDGGHYIGVAENGYAHLFQYAFFPLYPSLIQLGHFIFRDYFIGGLFISNVGMLGMLGMLGRFARENWGREISFRTLVYLLLFPTAFFLGAAYTESLFLLFTVSAFYFGFKGKWFLASLIISLACATKFVGIFGLVGLVVEYMDQRQWNLKAIKKDLSYLLLIGPAGLLGYMYFLFDQLGSPLFFISAQSNWHRSTQLVNPLRVLWNNTWHLQSSFFDYFFTLSFLLGSIFIFLKIRRSLGVYTFLITLFPLLSGTLESMSRYVLIGFPMFLLLAKLGENRMIDFGIRLVFSLFLAYFTILFLLGAWVG